jgi:hypothetical protein
VGNRSNGEAVFSTVPSHRTVVVPVATTSPPDLQTRSSERESNGGVFSVEVQFSFAASSSSSVSSDTLVELSSGPSN